MTAEDLQNMDYAANPAPQAATHNPAWARALAPRPRNHARSPALRASEVAGRCALTRPRASSPMLPPAAAGSDSMGSAAVGSAAIGSAAVGSAAVDSAVAGSVAVDSDAVDSDAVGSAVAGSVAMDSDALASAAADSDALASAAVDTAALGSTALASTATAASASPAPGSAARTRPAHASPPWPRLHWPRLLIRPYAPADLDALILQPGQAHVQAQLAGRGYAQALAQTEAYTVLLQEEEGGARVIACLGAHALHPGRALAWGLLSRDCGPHLLALTRAVRRWLASGPYARIEAHAEQGFAAGARWLGLLGFACETPQGMRRFTPEGRDSRLYAWLREEAPAAPPCPASTSTSTSEPFPDTARPA